MYAASNTVTSVDGSDSIAVLIDNNSDKDGKHTTQRAEQQQQKQIH